MSFESKVRNSKSFFKRPKSIYLYTFKTSEEENNYSEIAQNHGSKTATVKNNISSLEHDTDYTWLPLQRYKQISSTLDSSCSKLKVDADKIIRPPNCNQFKETTGRQAITHTKKIKGLKSTSNERGIQKNNRIGQYKNLKTTINDTIRNEEHENNFERGVNNLYINNTPKVLHNKTHYSLYSMPFRRNYNRNYLLTKQKNVKKNDNNFNLPLSTSYIQEQQQQMKNERGKKTDTFKKSIYLGHTNMYDYSVNRKTQNKQQLEVNGTHIELYPINYIPRSLDQSDLSFRQWLFDIIKYLDEQNLKDEAVSTYTSTPEFLMFTDKYARVAEDRTKTELTKLLTQWVDKLKAEAIFTLKNESLTNIIKKIERLTETDLIKNVKNTAKSMYEQWQQQFRPQITNETKHNFIKNRNVKTNNDKKTGQNPFTLWKPYLDRVKDYDFIMPFLKQIENNTFRFLSLVKDNITDRRWAEEIENLAKAYKDKYSEFVNNTSQHRVRSRMGLKKVIFNSIDVSSNILKRLVNFAADEMDKNGLLFKDNPLETIVKELKKETVLELTRACSEFAICRSDNGIASVFAHISTAMRYLNNDDLEMSFNNLLKAVKSVDWNGVFEPKLNNVIHDTMTDYLIVPLVFKRAKVNSVDYILKTKNKPWEMEGGNINGNIPQTLAIFKVVDILDESVPKNETNVNAWTTIKSGDILSMSTMTTAANNLRMVIDELDDETLSIVEEQVRIMFLVEDQQQVDNATDK